MTELGYGTTGLTVGQRVFGLTDWSATSRRVTRSGTRRALFFVVEPDRAGLTDLARRFREGRL